MGDQVPEDASGTVFWPIPGENTYSAYASQGTSGFLILMKITQLDIARQANVSQSTVSRVLSGDEKVDGELMERVKVVLERENYHVNARARGLRKRTSGQIGLVLKRPTGGLEDDPFVSTLISCMTEVLSSSQYVLCVDLASSSEEQAQIYEQMLRSDRVDGVVVLEPEMRDERLTRLLEDQFPFVVIGDPGEAEVPSVDNDNVMAGYLATKHLVEGGRKRVGMLAGPKDVRFSEDRIQGYVRAVREVAQAPLIWHSEFGLRFAREAADKILDSTQAPDGLVVLDDVMAVSTAGVAHRRGLAVPTDLALVGFNNSGFCDLVEGGLTSVDLKMETMIRTATLELLELLNGKKACRSTRMIVPCSLVERGSSASRRAAL